MKLDFMNIAPLTSTIADRLGTVGQIAPASCRGKVITLLKRETFPRESRTRAWRSTVGALMNRLPTLSAKCSVLLAGFAMVAHGAVPTGPLDEWTFVHPRGPLSPWGTVAHGNGRYV